MFERCKRIPGWAMCVGAVILANLPLVTGHYFLTYDSVMAFYPWHHYLRQQPFFGIGSWIPLAGCGFPGGSNGQMGFFFPLNLPLYLPISTFSAMIISTILCLIVAALGAYLLIRSYDVEPMAAVVGAIVYAAMGAMLAHIDHLSMIGAAALIPYTCYAARLAVNGGTLRWGAVAGVTVGLQFLASYPQIAGMGAITATLMLGSELWIVKKAKLPGILNRSAAFLAVTGIIGLGIGAVQAWPMVELGEHSVRGNAHGYEFCTSYSLPLAHLSRFVVPNLFGANQGGYFGAWNHQELHPYVGLITLMLAGWLLLRSRNTVVKSLCLVCVIALLFALGRSTPLYRILCHMPYFGTFRCPARWLFVTSMLLGVCASMALAKMTIAGHEQDVTKLAKWMVWLAAGCVLVFVIGIAAEPIVTPAIEALVVAGKLPVPSATVDGNISAGVASAYQARIIAPVSTLPYAAAALFLAGVGLWGFAQKRWGRNTCFGFVIIGMTLEAGLMTYSYNPYSSAEFFEKRPVVTAELPTFPTSGRYYYEADEAMLRDRLAVDPIAKANQSIAYYVIPRDNLNVAHGLASYRIYDPLELADQAKLRGLLRKHLHSADVAAMVGIEYVIVSKERSADYTAWELVSVVEKMHILRNPAYIGLAYIAHRVAGIEQLERDVANVASIGQTDSLLNTAYGENLVPVEGGQIASNASTDHVEVQRWDSRQITLHAECAAPGYLIVTNNVYPGWEAMVDGVAVEIDPVNIAFTGIQLPAGKHTVELVYSTPRLKTGAFVTGLAVLLGICLIVLGGERTKSPLV